MYSKYHKLGASSSKEFEYNDIPYALDILDITFCSRTHLPSKTCVSDEGVVPSMFVLFVKLREQNNNVNINCTTYFRYCQKMYLHAACKDITLGYEHKYVIT